ncbi:MAG: hypothetical protein RIQ56_220, partial [Candidatus Parcubacteria bacterium]
MKSRLSAARRVFFSFARSFLDTPNDAGKITLISALSGAAIMILSFGMFFEIGVPRASADNVVTSVTVLNTPPVWGIDAEETVESSTSTPTNSGFTIAWSARGDDSNNDNYWLIICKTGASPTPNINAAPSCGGGVANQWAVSASTASGVVAYAATTTKETFPFDNEKNDWFAWICDGNSSLPQCNILVRQGCGTTRSPFVVNHPPVFSAIANDSPAYPGETMSWTATATDTDLIRGGDTVKLYVCKAADFATSTCGGGGTWATSSFFTFDPSTTTLITIPTPDATYSAFVYVADNNNRSATSTFQGFNSSFVVLNATPTISAATVTLVDTDNAGNLTLLTPSSTTAGFKVQFQVDDNNSCQSATSTNEISGATANVYRSGVGQASCQLSGDFNTNSCYPNAS